MSCSLCGNPAMIEVASPVVPVVRVNGYFNFLLLLLTTTFSNFYVSVTRKEMHGSAGRFCLRVVDIILNLARQEKL